MLTTGLFGCEAGAALPSGFVRAKKRGMLRRIAENRLGRRSYRPRPSFAGRAADGRLARGDTRRDTRGERRASHPGGLSP